jgi:hypothetical protein
MNPLIKKRTSFRVSVGNILNLNYTRSTVRVSMQVDLPVPSMIGEPTIPVYHGTDSSAKRRGKSNSSNVDVFSFFYTGGHQKFNNL